MGRTSLPAAEVVSGTPAMLKLPGAAARAPWRWSIQRRSLIIRLPETYQLLSWAPFGGGARRACVIINHQIAPDDRAASENPHPYLEGLVRRCKVAPATAAAMMTGADVARAGYAMARRGGLMAGAWCTAGCSNALRVGDPAARRQPRAGTINLAVAVSQPLSESAMVEAVAIAAEARVAAMYEAGIASTRTGLPATGTGTDCIVIASPARAPAHAYCGKHTVAGELIGKAAMRACARALRRCCP